MTSALYNHVPGGKPSSPQLDLLRLFWRMQAPSGKTLICGLYQMAGCLEVRCGYGDDDLLRSQFAPDLNAADAVAEAWKATVIAKGGFSEMEEA